MPTQQHLDRVEIRRFRGLSDLGLDGLGSFNLLLGANDVGKTSVLEALFLLTGFGNLGLPFHIQRWRGLPLTQFVHLEGLFHQLDPDQPVELVAHSGGPVVRRTLQISAPYTELELDPDAPASPGAGNGGARTSPSVGPAGGQSSSLASARRRVLRYDATLQPRDGEAASFSGTLRLQAEGVKVKQTGEPPDDLTISARYMSPGIGYDASAVGELIVRKEVDRLCHFLKLVNPRIQDIAVSGDLVYLDIGLARMIPLNLSGSGMARAATVLSHCILGKERLLFIDELENGLHHAALRPFLEALLILIREHNMQAFVTTHSVALLQTLLEVLGTARFAPDRAVTNCYTLQRDREGHARPYRYEYEQFEHCVRHGIEIR